MKNGSEDERKRESESFGREVWGCATLSKKSKKLPPREKYDEGGRRGERISKALWGER